MEAYLRAAADLTTFPLFLDSPSSEVRLAGCRMRVKWVLVTESFTILSQLELQKKSYMG